jgi:hypothetical protein
VIATLLVAACGATPPIRYAQRPWTSGWSSDRVGSEVPATPPAAISASASAYPVRFQRVTGAQREARERALRQANTPWVVHLASSGFLATAEMTASDDETLSSGEREAAQRFLDTHLDLVGLTKPAPLEKWDAGLWFVSPIGDPRFGIAVQHRGNKVTIAGHLWPSLALRSNLRRSPAELLRPWLGARVVSGARREWHPCDQVSGRSGGCGGGSSDDGGVTIITPEIASYVVYGLVGGDFIEVREALVLPLPDQPVMLDAREPLVPPAVDARTGEPLDLTALGAGMCEEEGACLSWTWSRSETNFLFWHWVSFERLQLADLVFRPRVQHVTPAPTQ